MTINCIVVDDSATQRIPITKLVNDHPSLKLIGEYGNAIEAKNALKTKDVDLIFLDIEMPVLDGFDLLAVLDDPPQVIVVTGKTEYAFKAFDYDVADYLHKPLNKKRFDLAIDRVIANIKSQQVVPDEETGEHIFVKSDLKQRKVFLSQIQWVEALGDYIKLITKDETIVVLSTMKAFEQLLPKERFLRVHKSYIINLDKVTRFDSRKIGIGENVIPLSRNKKEDLLRALEEAQ